MEERRKSKRLGLTGELILNPLSGSNPETISIEITDASKSGLGFTTDKHLTIGDIYEANLTIWTKEVLHVFMQITRGSEIEGGFSYGAFFIGMPDADAQRITAYETVQELTQNK
ncbi:MAG: PilZ domain-containing protein [Butyrivibrio sp.]|nr:PilZ domain-containing protein [Butyrivibrio sp.]